MAPRNRKAHKKPVKTAKLQTRQGNKSILVALGVIVAVVVLFGVVAALNPSWIPTNTDPTPIPSPTPVSTPIPASENPYEGATKVLIRTTMGDITVELRNDMPITTGNFVKLVNDGVYNGSSFHRIMDGFMIQGGKPAENGISDPNVANIKDEFTTTNHNYNGTIAMANTGFPNTGSSQFFINVADNNNRYATFDSSYPAFGRVISGMDVVMAISQVATDASDAPVQSILIIGAKVLP